MARYSLDTSTISHILRKDWLTVHRFRATYDAEHEFLLCPIVYYELRRGLERKGAIKQMSEMEEIVAQFRWQNFERDVWAKAAQGWAEATRKGLTPGDADILIAYHAHHFDAILVTANVKHFEVFDVQIENWASGVSGSR
jgi:predicted nucleic acid-binding protein